MKDGVLHDLHGYDVVEEVEVAHHTIVFDEHMDDNDENILKTKIIVKRHVLINYVITFN